MEYQIKQALEMLASKYPDHEVAVWAVRKPSGETRFTARIAVGEYGLEGAESVTTDNPIVSAQTLISTVGDRTACEVMDRKISDLRQQLEYLESQQKQPTNAREAINQLTYANR